MKPRRAYATRLSATLLCGIVLGAQVPAAAEVEPGRVSAETNAAPLTVEQVLAVWSRREAGLRSFRGSWIHERTYTKFWAHCHVPSARDEYVTLRFDESVLTLDGYRLRFDSGRVDSSGDAIEFASRQTLDLQGRLAHDDASRAFRDDRIRYDGGRPRVDPREPETTTWPRNLRAFTLCSAGESNWQFLPAERGEYPEAYIFAGATNGERDSLHLLPLIAYLRPSWLGLLPSMCRIDAAVQLFDGRECRVLVDDSGLRREFWLDGERDFAPVSLRMECDVLGARMRNRIDVEYYRNADGHWLPSGWTTVFYDNYGLMEHYSAATVIDAAANPAVSGQEFEPTFPVGTWVYDEPSKTHAIVTAGGNREPITESELRTGMSYAELAARGTWRGKAGAIVKVLRQWPVVPLVVMLLLAGAAAGWLRRRMRLRTRREPFNV
jgi:hypothetical protein